MTPIDFFDKLRYWNDNRCKFLNTVKYYSAVNFLSTFFANIFLPVYFNLTRNCSKNRLATVDREGQKIIVSVTSFPKRFKTLHLVIESLLRQTVKPDKIVLYLTKSQVGDVSCLPKSLLKLKDRGLCVELCEDEIRSHTKYYYAFKQFPDDIVITADDDLFYRSDFVESLLKSHRENPDCIIANWTKLIIPGKIKYTEWPDAVKPVKDKNQLLLGVGGVLYPPHCMHTDLFDVQKIKDLAFTADDVWLTAMALLKGTNLYFTGYKYNYLPVLIFNNETLISGNYVRNQMWIDKINDFYKKKIGIAPFIDVPLKNLEEKGQK